jgi:hypothetical protein
MRMPNLNRWSFSRVLPALCGVIGVLFGCSSVRPISNNSVMAGRPAQAMTIVVPSVFSFRPGLVVHILPAGRYTPTLEDEKGIYFQAPGKLALGNGFGGTTLHDGGVYLKKDGSTAVYDWLLINDATSPVFRLPSTFQYSIENVNGGGG